MPQAEAQQPAAEPAPPPPRQQPPPAPRRAAGAAGGANLAAAAGGSAVTLVRLLAYGLLSTLAATAVVVGAFRQRPNFYSAAVLLGRSNGCMLVLLNFGIFLTFMFGKACQRVFFGTLRPVEVEHIYERSWYAVTESLLAMTIFRDDFDASFVMLFGTLLFLKIFHWLSSDRVELMEQSPSVGRLFHLRLVAIMWTLCCLDLFLVAFSLEVIILDRRRMGIMIMFASEFLVLTATLWNTIAKYLINCRDMRSEEPWEAKSFWIFVVDVVTDFLKLATYLGFFILILTFYSLPLNMVRDVYFTSRSFFGRIRDFLRYRAATKNMDSRFPDATEADMRVCDGTCIICREDMVVRGQEQRQGNDAASPPSGGGGGGDDARRSERDEDGGAGHSGSGLNETPKKLPCGHIFHFHCLRSWLERQQSCPTCRRTVFSADAPQAETPARPPRRQGAQPGADAPTAAAAPRPEQGGPAAAQMPRSSASSARGGVGGDAMQGPGEGEGPGARPSNGSIRDFLRQLQSDARRVREEAEAASSSSSTTRSARDGGVRAGRHGEAQPLAGGGDSVAAATLSPPPGPSTTTPLRQSRAQPSPGSSSAGRAASPTAGDGEGATAAAAVEGASPLHRALLSHLFAPDGGEAAQLTASPVASAARPARPATAAAARSPGRTPQESGVPAARTPSVLVASPDAWEDGWPVRPRANAAQWLPPPPWSLRTPPRRVGAGRTDAPADGRGKEGRASGGAEVEGSGRTAAEAATAADGERARGGDVDEEGKDEDEEEDEGETERRQDAREAARQAALKRFAAMAGKGDGPVSGVKGASAGDGDAARPDASPAVEATSTTDGRVKPAEASARPAGDPHLLPLFDTSLVDGFGETYADALPYPLLSASAERADAQLRAGLRAATGDDVLLMLQQQQQQQQQLRGAPPSGTASNVASEALLVGHELGELSEEQLSRLGETTRRALEERLRLLGRVQGTVWDVIQQLSLALSVMGNAEPTPTPTPPPPPPPRSVDGQDAPGGTAGSGEGEGRGVAPAATAAAERQDDKGKRPAEGLHACG